jgi:hypothetical protein
MRRAQSISEHDEASPGHLEHVSGEDTDQAIREIDELRKRWNDGLSVVNLALAKRYLEFKLEFGFVLVTRIRDARVATEFVAIFERKLVTDGRDPRHGARGQMFKAGARDVPLYSEHHMRCGYRDEQSVFVGDVNPVQTVEGLVPSSVRIEVAHDFYRCCARPLDSFDGTRSKVGLARTYWERCTVTGHPTVLANKSVSEEVERGAQIMDAVTNDCAPFVGDRDERAITVDFVTGTRFFVGDDSVRLERLESPNGDVKVRKVFFGPVNLYANAA